MPLTMQADELAPGHQNVVRRRAFARPPDRAGGDGAAHALENVAEVASRQFGSQAGGVERYGMRGDVDQHRLEPLGIGVAELELAELLEVVVQQPGVVERRLEEQRLAPGHGGPVAAVHRACRKLLAADDVRAGAPRLRPGKAAAPLPWRPVASLSATISAGCPAALPAA